MSVYMPSSIAALNAVARAAKATRLRDEEFAALRGSLELRADFTGTRVRWAMRPDEPAMPGEFAAAIKADLEADYHAQMDAAMLEMFGDLEGFRPTGLAQPAPPESGRSPRP